MTTWRRRDRQLPDPSTVGVIVGTPAIELEYRNEKTDLEKNFKSRCQKKAIRNMAAELAKRKIFSMEQKIDNLEEERSTTSCPKHCTAMDVSKNIFMIGEYHKYAYCEALDDIEHTLLTFSM